MTSHNSRAGRNFRDHGDRPGRLWAFGHPQSEVKTKRSSGFEVENLELCHLLSGFNGMFNISVSVCTFCNTEIKVCCAMCLRMQLAQSGHSVFCFQIAKGNEG